MTTRIFERAKVDENGNIRGLEAHRGEEFLLVKTPKLPDAKGMEKSRAVLDEVVRYAKEHRELAERQYEDFKGRYGDPADRFRELTSHLTAEELARRTKEIRDVAEQRLAEVRKDVEATYAKLEQELEQRAQTILKRDARPSSGNGAARREGAAAHGRGAVVTIDEQAAAGSVENRDDREREF